MWCSADQDWPVWDVLDPQHLGLSNPPQRRHDRGQSVQLPPIGGSRQRNALVLAVGFHRTRPLCSRDCVSVDLTTHENSGSETKPQLAVAAKTERSDLPR